MRKSIIFLMCFFIITGSFASITVVHPPLKASEIFFPVGKTGTKISLLDLSQIKVKDFELLTDRKMNVFNRVLFAVSQKRLKSIINRDGTISSRKMERFVKRFTKDSANLGGFALGFFLGLIGVLIAYLIKDDYKKNRVKMAWIGWGAALVILLIIIATTDFTIY